MLNENYDILITDLMNILGLSIKDNKIYDEENFTYLVYNGGYLYPSNAAGGIYHKKDTEFLPLTNYKLTKYLFNVLLAKETEENSLYVNSYGSTPHIQQTVQKYRLEVSTNNGHFVSDYYRLETIQYIDIMFKITGSPIPVDLHEIDDTLSEINSEEGK